MDVRQVEDGSRDPNTMSVDELQARVDELRGNGVGGRELIDAIIEPGSYTEFVIRLPSSTGHEEAP